MKKISLLLGVFFLIVSADISNAGEWLDDWIAQKTSQGPDFFSTQKRGYGTAGSMNMRFRQSNDYLVSLAKPRFKAGCGGIALEQQRRRRPRAFKNGAFREKNTKL